MSLTRTCPISPQSRFTHISQSDKQAQQPLNNSFTLDATQVSSHNTSENNTPKTPYSTQTGKTKKIHIPPLNLPASIMDIKTSVFVQKK